MRRLEEYEPILSQALRLCARQSAFECQPPLGDVLASHPRLIVAVNHSTPLSWLPAAALLVVNAVARGGGLRTPMGVMDRFFFHVPFFRELAHLITQTERPLSSRELIEKFEASENLDLVVFPEGSNCFFGRSDEVQEFRSPKFVEIALRTESPILIVAHWGSENWAKSIEVPQAIVDRLGVLPPFMQRFFEKRLKEKGKLVLPMWPAPMERFSMRCELYHPSLSVDDLADDADERFTQIAGEAERIRNRMCELVAELSGEKQRTIARN